MREVIYFVADDGRRFEDERECREYELECLINENADELVLLNDNKKVLKMEDFGDCHYIIVRGPHGIEALKVICDYYGFYTPWDKYCGANEEKCGIYYYNSRENSWENLGDEIEKLHRQIEDVKFVLGNEFGFETLYK